MSNAIVVAGVSIRADEDGRFCINDFHKASGGEKRHSPNYWLNNKQTVELIEQFTDTVNPVSTIRGGINQGTFVVKEMIYAYAMWVSAAFHLKVIRTFDNFKNVSTSQLPNFNDPVIAARAWADAKEGEQKAIALAEEQKLLIEHNEPKVNYYDDVVASTGLMAMADAAKLLGFGRNKFFEELRSFHILQSRGSSRNVPYQQYINQGYFEVKQTLLPTGTTVSTTKVTPKGLAWLHKKLI